MAEDASSTTGAFSITKPPEGQILAVVKGSPDGPLDMFVASISGYHFAYQEFSTDPADILPDELDEWEKWELKPNRDPRTGVIFTPAKGDMWEEEFATIFVGPGRALYIPENTRYSKWENKPGGIKPELVFKDRSDSPFFYFQTNLAIPAEKVEVKGNYTIDPLVNTLLRTHNPYKTEFLAGGWVALVNAAVQAKIREYVGGKTFDQLREEHEQGNGGIIEAIMSLSANAPMTNTPLPVAVATAATGQIPRQEDGLIAKIGVEIIDVRFVKFDIITTEQKIRDALTAQETNRLLKEASRETAEQIGILAEANSEAAKKMVNAYGSGEAAASVRATELIANAIEHTKAEVVSINSPGISAAIPIKRKSSEQPPNAGGTRTPQPPKKRK